MRMSDGHNLTAHLFVCTNSRDKGKSCAGSGSIELRNAVKAICQDESKGWHGRVRINTAGCLGRCEKGIAAVLYPEGKWFENLTKEDGSVLEKALSETLG
jgi:(2Fe-2S) ferredoxin